MACREGQLTKIQINGFKSIRECSIDLKPINVLIGSNGAGKSNFIFCFYTAAEYPAPEPRCICCPKRYFFDVLQWYEGNRRN